MSCPSDRHVRSAGSMSSRRWSGSGSIRRSSLSLRRHVPPRISRRSGPGVRRPVARRRQPARPRARSGLAPGGRARGVARPGAVPAWRTVAGRMSPPAGSDATSPTTPRSTCGARRSQGSVHWATVVPGLSVAVPIVHMFSAQPSPPEVSADQLAPAATRSRVTSRSTEDREQALAAAGSSSAPQAAASRSVGPAPATRAPRPAMKTAAGPGAMASPARHGASAGSARRGGPAGPITGSCTRPLDVERQRQHHRAPFGDRGAVGAKPCVHGEAGRVQRAGVRADRRGDRRDINAEVDGRPGRESAARTSIGVRLRCLGAGDRVGQARTLCTVTMPAGGSPPSHAGARLMPAARPRAARTAHS